MNKESKIQSLIQRILPSMKEDWKNSQGQNTKIGSSILELMVPLVTITQPQEEKSIAN